MAIVNGYCTLQELKDRLNQQLSASDSYLESVIEASSRAIDGYCKRVFFSTAAQARYFDPDDSQSCFIDDATAVTEVATDENGGDVWNVVWLATDFRLEPYNAVAKGRPYTKLHTTLMGVRAFPTFPKSVKVTGTWGFAATVPTAVHEACLLLSSRFFRRKDAPLGVIGTSEMGTAHVTGKMDSDVAFLLSDYVKYVF